VGGGCPILILLCSVDPEGFFARCSLFDARGWQCVLLDVSPELGALCRCFFEWVAMGQGYHNASTDSPIVSGEQLGEYDENL